MLRLVDNPNVMLELDDTVSSFSIARTNTRSRRGYFVSNSWNSLFRNRVISPVKSVFSAFGSPAAYFPTSPSVMPKEAKSGRASAPISFSTRCNRRTRQRTL